jgi:glutathione-regulated potassium-efflux system ancillary protein KefG
MKVLVLFAHPAIEKSRVNRHLANAAQQVEGVTFHDLYREYPDHVIDVEAEQKLLLEHDVIVFQHPFYWYSTPSIIKEWLDLVLEYGFAYGEEGDQLKGKAWVHALSTGGLESAYSKTGHNRFTIDEFLAPLKQSAYLCGMPFLVPFVVHGAHRYSKNSDYQEIQIRYQDFLRRLVQHAGVFQEGEKI